MKARRLLTLALFLYLAPSVAVAAVKTWTGQSGGRWSTASNWSPAGAPADKDALSFPLLPAGRVKAMTNDLAGRTFQDLTFTINGYTLRGEALALTAGIHANQPNLGNTIETPVTLSGHQTFNVSSASGTLLLSGDINLNRANLAIDGRGNLNASGVIRNRGSVVLTGDNTVTFFGAHSNQLEGTVWVQSGTLILNKVSGGVGQIAVPGDLIVGSSGAASVRLVESGQIAAGSAVTIYQDCLLDLDGQTNTVGSLRFVGGGTVQTGTGRLVLGGDVAVEGLGEAAVIAGNLHLGNSDRVFTVGEVATGVDLNVTATVSAGTSGAPLYIGRGFTKAGLGTMRLAGANTYAGATDIDEGALAIGHGQALGAGGGLLAGTRVNANGQLRLDGVQVPDEPLMLSRAASSGHALASSGDSTWGGTVTLNTDSRLSSSGTLVLSNRVSGAGGLLLDGNRFEFAGAEANIYAGTTWVDCALVRLNHSVLHNNAIPGNLVVGANSPDASNIVQYALSQQIADTARVTLHLRSVLDLNGRADWIGELEFVGGIAPQHGHVKSGAGFLGVSNQVAAAEFAVGSIAGNLKLAAPTVFAVNTNGSVLVPAMIQEGGLTLRGGGNLNLQGINTFAGPVVVEHGLLFADGNFALGAITGNTTVQPGGTLNLQPSVTSLNEPLTLGGSGVQDTGALQAYGDITLPNAITLASDTVVFVETDRTLEITGAIGGAGSLTKTGTGTLALTGSATNTLDGDVYVGAGRLEMNRASGNSIPRRLIVGGSGAEAEAVHLANSEVDFVTVRRQGRWNLNGFNDSISDLVLVDGGRVSAPPPGRLNLVDGANLTVQFGLGVTGTAALEGVLLLGGVHTFSVADQFAPLSDPVDFVLSARVQGDGSILKTGSGEMSLTESNSFTGNLSIQGGQVRVGHNDALGTGVGGTLVLNNGGLVLEPGIGIAHEALTLDSAARPEFPALWAAGDTNYWTGPVGLKSAARVGVATNSLLYLSGQIAGAGDLIFEGPGKVILSGAAPNTYTGTTWFKGGDAECRKTAAHGAIPGPLVVGDSDTNAQVYVELTLTNLPQINALAPVVLHKLGMLRPKGDGEETLGSLAGEGLILFGIETNATALLIGGNNASTTFNGHLSSFNRGLRLAKRGSGQLTLGDEAYLVLQQENVWTVEAGTLCVNGRMSYGDLRVLPGATLSGSGELPSVTVSGGRLAPGDGPGGRTGLLTFGNLALESNAVVALDIQGPDDPALRDCMVIESWLGGDGEMTITNCTLEIALDAVPAEGVPLLIAYVDHGDPLRIQGHFAGLPEGSVLSVPPFSLRVNYNAQPDSDDQQVTLTLVNPPLASGTAQVVGNNVVPGRINPFECDALFIPFTNTLAIPLTGIRAVLSSPSIGLLVTQPESFYPDIPPGGVGVNLTPFQMSTFKSLQNGADIEVTFTTPDAPSFSASVHVDVGSPGPTYRFDNPASHTIPGRTTVDVPVDADSFYGTIDSVQASLHLTHPNIGDLELALVAHDGRTVLLSRALGGTNDAYGAACADRMRTTFTDTARTPIGKAAPPFAGAYRPIEPLAAFAGKDYTASSDDPWRLRIANRGHLPAQLECWSLSLTQLRSTNGSGGCLTCIEPILATLTTNHPVHLGQLDTDGPTSCARPNTCRIEWTRTEIVDDETWPFVEVTNTMYYQTHAFTNTGPATCVSAAISRLLSSWPVLHAAAYLDAFNPDAPCENYLGDVGQPAGAWPRSFSFDVPVGAQFIIVVSMSTENRSPVDYQLLVTGGDCPPPDLAITPDAAPGKVAVSWSTAAAGYQLETSPALSPPGFTRSTVSPAVVDGQFVVTNTAAGTSRYYRLHRP